MTVTSMTPAAAGGRMIIQSYGRGGFTIAGARIEGSVVVLPTRVLPWAVTTAGDIDDQTLAGILHAEERVELLIIGCGRTFSPAPMALAGRLRAAAIGLEWMDTGAACRTFNVLLTESRAVAAALIAVE